MKKIELEELKKEIQSLIDKNKEQKKIIEDLRCEIEIMEVLMVLQQSQRATDNLKKIIG